MSTGRAARPFEGAGVPSGQGARGLPGAALGLAGAGHGFERAGVCLPQGARSTLEAEVSSREGDRGSDEGHLCSDEADPCSREPEVSSGQGALEPREEGSKGGTIVPMGGARTGDELEVCGEGDTQGR